MQMSALGIVTRDPTKSTSLISKSLFVFKFYTSARNFSEFLTKWWRPPYQASHRLIPQTTTGRVRPVGTAVARSCTSSRCDISDS